MFTAHTHHQLICPLCLAITLRLCLVKITCEFCYRNRIIPMRVGADDDDSMSARDKMLGRFSFIYATSCCVLWIGEEDREKRERKYFVKHFWTIIHGEFFSLKIIPYLTSSFAVSPSFVVQNFFVFGGSCVLLLLLLLYLHESYRDKFLMLVCVHVW